MIQGGILAFNCTFVSLRGHIFASIEKFGSDVWNVRIACDLHRFICIAGIFLI